MEHAKKIGMLMIIVAILVAVFGVWLKVYNDKIADVQYNQTGTCILPDGTCIHTTADSIIYVAIGIAALIAAIGFYLILKKKEPQKDVAKNIIEKSEEKNLSEAPKTMMPESKKVFDLINQSNGAILQGELVAKSGMDKVKVSRILDKLEMQGLIERRRHGMSNLVVLKKSSK